MEKKKSIGAILLIIAILVIMLVIMLYFLNQNENKNKETLKIGTYEMQKNEEIYNPELEDYGANITFLNNQKFKATLVWGGSIRGTYKVSKNTIECTLEEFDSEYETTQKIEGFIILEEIENDIVKVKDASESIEIYIENIINKKLTDQTKKLSMEPYIKGMEFKLE